jgi:hypothetical protein
MKYFLSIDWYLVRNCHSFENKFILIGYVDTIFCSNYIIISRLKKQIENPCDKNSNAQSFFPTDNFISIMH